MSNGPVVALDIGILLGLAGLYIVQGNVVFSSPGHQCARDIFWPIINPNSRGFATPLDDSV